MTRWFRHYAGMSADPKFGGVARRCSNVAGALRVSRADVLFVWNCVLESAAEGNSAQYAWDADAIAELMGVETPVVQSIHDELERSGLLEKGRICKWDERQFVSDTSTQRSRKHRATLQQRNATAPETDTYTETDTEKKKEEEAREQVRTPPTQVLVAVPKPEKPKRGSRWPDDAIVPDEWVEEGEAYRDMANKPPIDLRAEALKFANYWAAKSGGDATKMDWKRTWLNWCLRANGGQNGSRTGAQSQLEVLADIARNGLRGTVVNG